MYIRTKRRNNLVTVTGKVRTSKGKKKSQELVTPDAALG